MRQPAVACALVLVAFAASAPVAQQRPDFTGRWIVAGAGSEPPQPLVVTQSATSLTVENWSSRGPRPGTYAWSRDAGTRGSATPSASWNGDRLVVTFPPDTSPELPAARTVRTETWSLDRTGKLGVTIVLNRPGAAPSLDAFLYSRAAAR